MEYFDILIKLRKILRTVNLESKRIEKSHGVSIPQLLVLQFLRENENYCSTASQIKKHINLNASTVSGILSRLNAKGLIVKTLDSQDKRSSQIVLTAKGLEFVSTAPVTMQERLAVKLNNMQDSEISELNRNIDLLITLMDLDSVNEENLGHQ